MDLQYRRISVGTVYNICKLFERTGEVSPKKSSHTRILSNYDELLIIGLLLDNPGFYLAEVCDAIKNILGISISSSTVCRTIQRNGLTHKRIQQIAIQRSGDYRGDFMAEMDFFNID